MSFGTTGTFYSSIKNVGVPGKIPYKDRASYEQKKIDYKTRKLRHPLRRDDDQEAICKIEMEKANDKKKFNKNHKDFIQINKDRFKSKDDKQHSLPDGSHIKPGTVTLTQKQLVSLLASLQNISDKSASNNTPEVQIAKAKVIGDDEDGFKSDAEIDALLKEVRENVTLNSRMAIDNVNGVNTEGQIISGHEQKLQLPQEEQTQKVNGSEFPQHTQLSWPEDKLSTPSMVPWKHLTMGEKKRLQWARERAETQDIYDPWGKPGAGAPRRKIQDETQSGKDDTGRNILPYNKTVDYKQQQDLLLSEIEKLQQEIQQTEQKKLHMEEKHEKTLIASKKVEREVQHMTEHEKTALKKSNEGQLTVKGMCSSPDQSKKELERQKWLSELDKQRQEQQLRKHMEKEREHEGIHDHFADVFEHNKTVKHISPRHEQTGVNTSVYHPGLSKVPDSIIENSLTSPALRGAVGNSAVVVNETRHESMKADEKRRWLEELDRQREEQRMAKLSQKEKDRQSAGIWIDHYPADHEKLRQGNEILKNQAISPRTDETPRTNSAPHASVTDANQNSATHPSFLRGQGAIIDPVTRKEQEEKRRVQLEYQAQVKAQIEEKEKKKRDERERKLKEDMEEEKRLQMERHTLNQQMEMEQTNTRRREELRQKQMTLLKSALDQAQESALEVKNVKRIHHLQQRGHDVSQLRAAYEATNPHIREYETSQMSGQGMESLRGNQAFMTDNALTSTYNISANREQLETARSNYKNEPNVENHLLTPNTYRDSNKYGDMPDLSRREFGTQTVELKELQNLLKNLPEDIQIEYKMKVEDALQRKDKTKQAPVRKTHAKNTSKDNSVKKRVIEAQHRDRSQKLEDSQQWNQRKRKTAVKNSEKDPFYLQNQREAEMRKVRREQRMLYLQELNKDIIPTHFKSPSKCHCESVDGVKQVEKGHSRGMAANEAHNEKPYSDTVSPKVLSNLEGRITSTPLESIGRNSPPIPAVRHRTNLKNDMNKNPYQFANNYLQMSQADSKYVDAVLPTGEEFVPFMRTTEILDPSKADEPVVVSRENSQVERARNAYFEIHHPANTGKKLDMYRDLEREATLKTCENPLAYPSIVSSHPTARQEMILQQLSSLKQTLKSRQKELEDNMLPPGSRIENLDR